MVDEKSKRSEKEKRGGESSIHWLFVGLGVVAFICFGIFYGLSTIFGEPLKSPEKCCASEISCGGIIDLPDSDNFVITSRWMTSTHVYFCRADGSVISAWREAEDTSVELSQDARFIAIIEFWNQQIRYYDAITLELDYIEQCDSRPYNAVCPVQD